MKLSSLVLMMFLFSCVDSPPPKYGILEDDIYYRITYRIVQADSCEYILFSGGRDAWGGHRARCKYCAARNNKPCK